MKIVLLFLLVLCQDCLAQNAKVFKTCDKAVVYTVDDWVLRKEVGMELTIPSSNPKFKGGREALEKYFKAHSISTQGNFRVFISFVVNCKGEVGKIHFREDAKGDLKVEETHKEILEIVKRMPRKWQPAISKEGKPVDSYQMIYFTFDKGKFVDVDYK